jgi:apolipoprotein N-acyltransferase
MNFRWHTRALLALGSGAALALSFPNYNLWLLAWIAIGMLVLASSGARPISSPLYGFLHGLVFYPVGLPWIAVVMEQYGNVDPWTSAGVLGLMAIAGGIVCSFFSLGVALASRKGSALACVLAPCLWVTLEFARTHLPIIGFPWNLTGYAASGNLALVQLTPLTGIYGLTFVIAAYGSLLAYAILVGTQRAGKGALVVTAALILIAAGGRYFVPKAASDHVAHLVQTNFPQSEHYPSNWLDLHAGEMDELERISVNAALKSQSGSAAGWDKRSDDTSGATAWDERGEFLSEPFETQGKRKLRPPKNRGLLRRLRAVGFSSFDFRVSNFGLIIWPEVPAPFSLQEVAFEDRAARIARESHSYFLVGVVDWKLDPARKYYATNSAVLLDPDGQRVFTYDKIHLVPFGEYVPLRQWIKFAGRLTADISDFTPGTQYRVGQIPGGKFGVFICYEAIFPDEIRRFTKNGAELLINISNDGWFGRSSAPAQHLMMARVRAVENRRWLLRDTNNGYTVAVDPYGRIVASMPTDIRGEVDAPYAFRSDITPYTRLGDWFARLCLIASLALLVLAFRNKSRYRKRGTWKARSLV